jgi:3-dehydroquinate synthase
MDRLYLETLPFRHLKSGWSEALKHAFIRDLNLLEWYEDSAEKLTRAHRFADLQIQELLYRTLTIKSDIVQKDELEKGERRLLNFGHTLGHAFEHTQNDCLHGEAVALGMSFALEWSHVFGSLSLEQAQRGCRLLQAYQLEVDWRASFNQSILDVIQYDKKRQGDQLTLVTLLHLGQAQLESVSLSLFLKRVHLLYHQTSVL